MGDDEFGYSSTVSSISPSRIELRMVTGGGTLPAGSTSLRSEA